MDLTKPVVFWGPDGKESEFYKGFEKQCFHLEKHLSRNPRLISAMEFLGAIQALNNNVIGTNEKD